jgi:manganese transport protein
VELAFARPILREVFSGIVPRINTRTLYDSVVILGATVMPHNLYLHSALVQTRRIGRTLADKREACKFNFFDSFLALNGAMIVNAAILVLAAAVFFNKGVVVDQIEQAQSMLSPLLGTTLASVLFSIALLASGQSSTLTGTYAGQIVMEGFLDLRMRPWLRRLATRSLAIIPAIFTVMLAGEKGTFDLLLLSQVIISMQLPFAVIPLIRFTSDRGRMGQLANGPTLKIMAWTAAAIILILNVWLAWVGAGSWLIGSAWRIGLIGPVILAVMALLGWVTFAGPKRVVEQTPRAATVVANLPEPVYRSILVPLDHSDRDRAAIAHAAAMARLHQATLHLLHVEEGVTSQFFGALSSTAEIQAGEQYFSGIVESLERDGIRVELSVVHGRSPKDEIVKMAREIHPDLVVMGAHGHRGVKDLIFGNTINGVRHEVAAPVLVVGEAEGSG